MNENNEKITREDESRAAKIARIVAKLPEKEQEKVYYTVKGIELAESVKSAPRTAAVV